MGHPSRALSLLGTLLGPICPWLGREVVLP
jgi:hypothetical protein